MKIRAQLSQLHIERWKMKTAVLGAFLGAGLVVAALGSWDHRGELLAEPLTAPYGQAASNELIAVAGPADDQGQLLTVIDPRQQVMGVYHIARSDGNIELRSVRNIHWDLQMLEFNCERPLPREIRALLDQR